MPDVKSMQKNKHVLTLSVFYISSSESKRDFLKTVHSVLRDKQRRQLLKTESLPLNQQYAPFGGKRFLALKGVRPMNRAGKTPITFLRI